MVMQDINMARLREHMEKMEGRKNEVYPCRGLKHAGIGHLLKGHELDWPIGRRVSDEQVEKWFAEDTSIAYTQAKSIVGPAWFDMGEQRREACVDAVFQLGGAGFRRFKKCVAAIHGRNYGIAAIEMLDSKAAKQTPKRSMSRAKCWAYGSWQ